MSENSFEKSNEDDDNDNDENKSNVSDDMKNDNFYNEKRGERQLVKMEKIVIIDNNLLIYTLLT